MPFKLHKKAFSHSSLCLSFCSSLHKRKKIVVHKLVCYLNLNTLNLDERKKRNKSKGDTKPFFVR